MSARKNAHKRVIECATDRKIDTIGRGWVAENRMVYMTRCYKCGLENYAPLVSTGQCAWCGYIAVKEDIS